MNRVSPAAVREQSPFSLSSLLAAPPMVGSSERFSSGLLRSDGFPYPSHQIDAPMEAPRGSFPRVGDHIFFTVIAKLLQRTIFHVAVKVVDERTEPPVIDGTCVVMPKERLLGGVKIIWQFSVNLNFDRFRARGGGGGAAAASEANKQHR